MKQVDAEIHLTVMCDCPHCGEHVNLYSTLSGQCIDIFKYAEWKEPVDVTCPECGKRFEVILYNY